MVRAKFKCVRIEASEYSKGVFVDGKTVYQPKEVRTVVLSPVYSNDPNSENAKFFDATPVGEVKLGTLNPEAWSAFELGKEYYLDFTPAT